MRRGVVSLVGAGAVGPVLLRALVEAGWTAGAVASRSPGSARAVADSLGASFVNENAAAARDRALRGNRTVTD